MLAAGAALQLSYLHCVLIVCAKRIRSPYGSLLKAASLVCSPMLALDRYARSVTICAPSDHLQIYSALASDRPATGSVRSCYVRLTRCACLLIFSENLLRVATDLFAKNRGLLLGVVLVGLEPETR